uniref:Uncharacterized protein n=1 Tax=Arundo donax TaxID=35708 RepID=A0A0A9CED5_ARUDO
MIRDGFVSVWSTPSDFPRSRIGGCSFGSNRGGTAIDSGNLGPFRRVLGVFGCPNLGLYRFWCQLFVLPM